MTRSQLISILAERLGLDPRAADAVVRSVFETMQQALRHGHGIELRGFGTFSVRAHGGYRGRNPRSGEHVDAPDKVVPAFKVGKPMRARLARAISTRRSAPASRRASRPAVSPRPRGGRALAAREGGE